VSAELHEHHRRLLEVESAIAPDVIAERGAFTATQRKQLRKLHFSETQAKLVPALVLPVRDVFGRVALHQARPDDPRRDANGKPIKYETPARARMAIDVPQRVRAVLADPSQPLVVTEGIRKDDAAVSVGLNAIALLGVWNWRGRNEHGGLTALADWHEIALNERRVLLAFDSDAMAKREVHDALKALIAFLRRCDADPWVIYLPSLNGGAKTGLDDYLAAGHSANELLALARPELLSLPGEATSAAPKPKPTPERVGPLAELLDRTDAQIRRYVALPRVSSQTLALFTAHTHVFRAGPATPYQRVVSPEHDAGKTTLLEVLSEMVANPWLVMSVTTAALVRRVDRVRPTLLLDEVDNMLGRDREFTSALLGILNAGYKASGIHTMCVGDGANTQERDFAAYCPKAFSGLGELPRALASRTITHHMQRATPDEEAQLEEWVSTDEHPDAERLHDELAAWADDAFDRLRVARPERVEGLRTRAWEVWRPLIAIADMAGGDWPERARRAAHTLAKASSEALPATDAHTLLVDLHGVFEAKGVDRIKTAELLTALRAIEDSPWDDYRGKPLGAHQLSALLRRYDVRSRTLRFGAEPMAKGYEREWFETSWQRYLSPSEADADDAENDDDDTDTPEIAEKNRHIVTSQAQSRIAADRETSHVTDSNARNPAPAKGCDDVTDRNRHSGDERDDAQLFEPFEDRCESSDFEARVDRLERLQEGE
jgi:hypothetical protein